jgi:hypothetical protein
MALRLLPTSYTPDILPTGVAFPSQCRPLIFAQRIEAKYGNQ